MAGLTGITMPAGCRGFYKRDRHGMITMHHNR
jgi:hypothetical protein